MRKLGELSKHATIRILIVNPESPHARARDLEEKQSPDTIKREAEEFITQFAELYHGNSRKLQLRAYDTLPMVNIFRIDRDLFWGPYLLDRNSSNTFTVRARRHGSVYSQLLAHFESVWAMAKIPSALESHLPDAQITPGAHGQQSSSVTQVPPTEPEAQTSGTHADT